MQLAVSLPYAEGGMSTEEVAEFARVADDLGYHSIWAAEAWSFDAFMVLTSLVPHTTRIALGTSIVNVYSRTPALIAQSVATLDVLSDGRAFLGVGASGPQVIEGWHGVPYCKPLQRTRETIEIVRKVLRRERLVHHGEVFDLGMGLKLINHPLRPSVPIAVAAIGPRNVELAAELADAWIPVLYAPAKAKGVFGPSLDAGRAKRSEDLAPLQVVASCAVAVGDDTTMQQQVAKHGIALYVGGMGSREANFYNALARRYGYEEAAGAVQDLYLSGKRDEAAAAVPDALVEEVSAIGPAGQVKDRFAEMAESGVDVLMVSLLAFDQKSRLEQLEALPSLI